MNNRQIREFIVDKVDEGYKFTEIVKILDEGYGIQKSKQSVHAIYKRAMAREEREEKEYKHDEKFISDILNIYVRGYKMSETHKILASLDYEDVKYHRVVKIINENEDTANEIRNKLILHTTNKIVGNADIDEIINSLTYKGVTINENALIEIIVGAYEKIIRNRVITYAAEAYDKYPSNEIIKWILKLTFMDIELKDVKARVRNK